MYVRPHTPVVVPLGIHRTPLNQMSIDTVKNKLSSHTGTSPSAMILQLKDEQGRLVATLADPCKPLGYYPVGDGWVRVVPFTSGKTTQPP